MPRFAANLSTMYQELAIPERFAAAANDGFTAVEFLNPYPFTVEELQSWLEANRLELILINTKPGMTNDKTVGLAAIPGREADFKKLFAEAHHYAQALGTHMIHVLAGVTTSYDSSDVNLTLRSNLTWAAQQIADSRINIMLEPLNEQDVPGYVYCNSQTVVDLIDQLNLPNLKLQYDLYHMQIMEGNLAKHLEQHIEKIGHVQFSSVPGRHEPQYGEVNVHRLFEHLERIGYDGWIGCEYTAKAGTTEGLIWAEGYNLGQGL